MLARRERHQKMFTVPEAIIAIGVSTAAALAIWARLTGRIGA